MDRLTALETFVAVVERGGFAPAGRHLGLSPPAVTRAIAGLEQRLGVTLLRRTTRSLALTDEGVALLERAREMLARWREAEHEAMGGQTMPRGELHVTAPVVFGRLHVLPVATALLAGHDGLSVRLLLLDRNIRLVEEGIDVAVRIGQPRDSSLRSVALGSVRQVLVASPDYLAARGRPARPEDLARHDLVAGDVRSGATWRFGAGSVGLAIAPRLTVSDVDARLAAAEGGSGIANVLSYQAAAGLAAGRLERVLDAHAPPALPVHLLFDAGRARLPSVRLFLEGMRSRWKTDAWQ